MPFLKVPPQARSLFNSFAVFSSSSPVRPVTTVIYFLNFFFSRYTLIFLFVSLSSTSHTQISFGRPHFGQISGRFDTPLVKQCKYLCYSPSYLPCLNLL